MQRFVLTLLTIFTLACAAIGQSPTGTWVTIDDETGKPKSHVQISERGGKLYGKVVELINPRFTICGECEGDKKDQPIKGMEILWGLSPDGDEWNGGYIMDPANGKEYKCKIELDGANTLKVRGYIGFSLLGRTQTWQRLES